MKRQHKKSLKLSTETIRMLDRPQLDAVAGGSFISSPCNGGTNNTCGRCLQA